MKSKLIIVLLALFFSSCDDDPENTECLPTGLSNNIIAFYPFSFGDLNDYSQNKNKLVNINSTLTEDRSGNSNCAFSFNISDGSFLKTNGGFTDNFHKKKFSISLWYKPIGNRDPGDVEYLILREKNDNSNLLPNWSLGLGDCRVANFSLAGKYLRDDKDLNFTCDQLLNEFSDKWHHLVCTFDGSNMTLYRNGVKSSELQDSDPFAPSFINTGEVIIGLNFTGILDDIIIFDKELSHSEVLMLWNIDACCF